MQEIVILSKSYNLKLTSYPELLPGNDNRVNMTYYPAKCAANMVGTIGGGGEAKAGAGRNKNGRRTLKIFQEKWYAREISRFVCNKVRLF